MRDEMSRAAKLVRRASVCLAALVPLYACSPGRVRNDAIPKASSPCVAAPVDLSYQTRILKRLRVYTGTDGVSHAQFQDEPAQESTYLGALLRQYPLGDPSNVVIVSGPPNFRIPPHPSPYREIFVMLAGSSIIELSDGTREGLRAGSVVLFEDTTGPGHAGLFGSCGYVALDIQFKPPAAVNQNPPSAH